MTLIGRSLEVGIMQGLLASQAPEMLTMYDRRREGKTYLIKTVYKDNMVFECSGLQDGASVYKMVKMKYEVFIGWRILLLMNVVK